MSYGNKVSTLFSLITQNVLEFIKNILKYSINVKAKKPVAHSWESMRYQKIMQGEYKPKDINYVSLFLVRMTHIQKLFNRSCKRHV